MSEKETGDMSLGSVSVSRIPVALPDARGLMYSVARGVVPRFWNSTVSVTTGLPWESAEMVLTAEKTRRGLKSWAEDVAIFESEVAAFGVTFVPLEE